MCMKKYFRWLPLVILSVLFLGYLTVFHDNIFLFSGDSFETMYQFYVGGYVKFHQGTLMDFDFSMGLGANPLYNSFYFLFSPFFYLTCLLPKEWIAQSFSVMLVLKLVLLYISVERWLKELNGDPLFCVLGALSFTFSGWSFFYSHYVFFLDHLFALPLLLWSIEKLLKQNKSEMLVLTVAYVSFSNYYFAYLFLAISCFYALCRAFCLNKEKVSWVFFKALHFLKSIVFGLMISSVTFLPNIYITLTNPRLNTEKNLSMMNKYELFKFVTGFFTPVTNRLDSNLFISDQWYRFLGWGNGAGTYMGILVLLALVLFLFIKKNRRHWITLGFFLLGGIFYLFPIFSYMFQGTMDTRWFLYFQLFELLLMSDVFKAYKESQITKKQIAISSAVLLCVMFGLWLVSFFYGLNDNQALKQCFMLLLVEALFVLGYAMVMIKSKKSGLIILLCGEIFFSGCVFFQYNVPLDSSDVLIEYVDNTVFTELEDGSFFRIIQDGYDYWPSNNAYAKDIAGVSFYNSIYNYEMEDYLSRFKSTWSMPVSLGQDFAYSLLSIRYWVTSVYSSEPPYGFEFVSQVGNLSIYENKNWIELGFGLSETVHPDALEGLSYLNQDLLMQKAIVAESSETMSVEMDQMLELVHEEKFTDSASWFDSVWDTILVFENENRNDLTVNLYYSTKLIKSYEFYNQHYFTLPLHELYYVSDIEVINMSDNEASVKVYHCLPEFLDEAIETRKQNAFYDTVVTDNHIEGKIELQDTMMVYTSVPYDRGWSVKVDGEEVEYEKVNLGFIGFELNEGIHEVEFDYQIPLVKEGMMISLCSLVVWLVFIILRRRTCLKK